MKKGLIIGLSVLLAFILILGITVGSFLSHRITILGLEGKVQAQYIANQSNYDNMWKSFVEMTQVTDIQAKNFKQVYTDLIQGRYDDPQLLFKIVQEQNPQFDQSGYTKIMIAIEAGRKSFANDQTKIADIAREYNLALDRYFITNMILNKQKIDASKLIIASEKTQGAFSTGGDGVINLQQTTEQ